MKFTTALLFVALLLLLSACGGQNAAPVAEQGADTAEQEAGTTESTEEATEDAASEAEAEAEEEIVITFWDHVQSSKDIETAYETAAEEFEASHPGVTIEIEGFPFESYKDRLLTAVQGGQGPDIMALDEVWHPEFAAAGVIIPIDDYIAASGNVAPEDFFAGAWETVMWDGHVYGLPLGFDVWEQLYYNPGMFEAAGLDPDNPPTTWDGWLEAAEALTTEDHFGIVIPAAQSEVISVSLASLLYSNGAVVLDADGNAAINSPEAVEALELYLALTEFSPPGATGIDHGVAESLFAEGKVAMILDGNWAQETMNDTAGFEWRIAVPPAPEGKEFIGALGGWNLAINSSISEREQELAYEFIEFFTTTDEVQVSVAANVPALISAANIYLETRTQPDVILETLETGKPRPLSPVYPAISDVIQGAVQNIVTGSDITDELNRANEDIQRLVDES